VALLFSKIIISLHSGGEYRELIRIKSITMKLTTKTQLGLLFAENSDYQMRVMATQYNQMKQRHPEYDETQVAERLFNVIELITDRDYANDNYLIRSTAIDMAKEIPLDGKFDIMYLKQLPTKKATLLMGDKLAFKYYKNDNGVYGVRYWMEGEGLAQSVNWTFFGVNFHSGNIIYPKNEHEHYEGEEALADKDFRFFLQMVLFVELSELKVEVLEPNRKTGTKRTGKFINQSKSKVHIVDSKWNVVSVRTDGFLVKGHWRWQPYKHEGESKVKCIWIDTFKKNGYIRKRKSNAQNTAL
jgi:hypothetical protein